MKYNFDTEFNADKSKFFRWSPTLLNMFFESEDVLPMWIAETEFKAAPEIIEALHQRAEEGVFCYEDKPKQVSESLKGWFQSRHQVAMDPTKVHYTISVLAGLSALIEEFTGPNEAVIIQPPVYQAFTMILNGIKRDIIHNPLNLSEGRYTINLEDLEDKLRNPNNRILLLCSPHNPVARVWDAEELTAIARLCQKHDVLIISDEIHCDTLLYGNKFHSMTEICRGITHNLIVIGSAGKTFGIPSLSDAYIYTENDELHTAIGDRLFRYHINKSNAFSNAAMIAAYTKGHAWVDQFNNHVQENVDFVRDFFNSRDLGMKLVEPEGTYQVWLDAREHALDDTELNRRLVEVGKIGLARGSGYGPGGEKFFRMNIGCPKSTLKNALECIERALVY